MTTRRDFLRQTALLGAGLTISPFFIKAGNAGVGANDKISASALGASSRIQETESSVNKKHKTKLCTFILQNLYNSY